MADWDKASLQAYAVQSAQRSGVPVDLYLWQLQTESGFDQNAKNPNSTASGVAQFTDPTAKWLGVDKSNPYDQISAGADYMAYLKNKLGSWQAALDAYGTTHNNPTKAAQAQAILDANGGDASNPTPTGDGSTNSPAWYDVGGQVKSYFTGVESNIVAAFGTIGIFLLGALLLALAVFSVVKTQGK